MSTQSNLFTNEHSGNTAIFSEPLGAVKKGRLEVTRGISNFYLKVDSETQNLFHGQFIGLIPDVSTQKELVTIHYSLSITQWFKHMLLANKQATKVSLNTSIPWQIDIHGGAAHIDADLQALQLSSLIITGGVAEANILLARPLGMVKIHLGSGASNVRIFRPAGVPARLKVGGGASRLTFDNQFYSSIGGEIRLESPDYKDGTNHYDISISSGVSNLAICTQG